MHLDPLTGWRRSKPQEKALKLDTVYMPAELRLDRALWRGLEAVLPANQGHGSSYLCPSIVGWISYLSGDEGGAHINGDASVLLHATGVVYGTQNSIITDIIEDSLTVHTALLAPQAARLVSLAMTCLAETEDAVRHVGFLAGNLFIADGGDPQTTAAARDRARETAYLRLDSPFRKWLAKLRPPDTPTDVWADYEQHMHQQWLRKAREVLFALGTELTEQASPQAFTGHKTLGGTWMTGGSAERIFRSSLRKALPTPDDYQRTTASNSEDQ